MNAVDLQRLKDRSVLNKNRRLDFLRSVNQGRLKCTSCNAKMRRLDKYRNLVTRSAYCPNCETVMCYDDRTTTLSKLVNKRLDYKVLSNGRKNRTKQETFKFKGDTCASK